MEQSEEKVLAHEELLSWVAKVTRIWQPTRILQIRQRAGPSFLFMAELFPDLVLHLGVRCGEIDLCAVWCGKECVLWDSLIGFCSSWEPITTPSDRDKADVLAAQWMPLIRRNCWLSGCSIKATEKEQCEWKQWMDQQPDTPLNEARKHPHPTLSLLRGGLIN